MNKSALYLAAVLVAATPALAFAQVSSHVVPGDGYRIATAPRTMAQPLAALQTDLSVPGNGHRIAAVPRTGQQPLAAYYVDPSVPGDGYRMNSPRW